MPTSPEKQQARIEKDYKNGELSLQIPVPEQGLFLSTQNVIISAKLFGEASGLFAPVVAGIHAGPRDDFLIVDTRKMIRNMGAPFLLVQDDEGFGVADIFPQQKLPVGRMHHRTSFRMNAFSSRDHFTLLYDDKSDSIFIEDLRSDEGTQVTGYIVN